MTTLRRWQLDSTSPFSLQIAADARLSQTDYADDQTWEVMLGAGEAPALALQTRYGGRAGLASIVPMWLHDGRVIYQTQAYPKPPVVTAFAPGYVRLEAALTLQVAVQAEYWVMASHAVGARYTLANADSAPVEIQLDLLGFVGSGGQEQKLRVISLPNGGRALSLGQVGNLFPIVILEGATTSPETTPSGSKISRGIMVEGRKKLAVRWVHAGLTDPSASIALAEKWLGQNWDTAFQQIEAAAQAIPTIETGNADWDATIAFSYHQLMQAFLKPTASLPHASFVGARQPERGFSPRGGGNDHDRVWSGQAPTLAYPTALGIASIDSTLAQGIIRNYLAVQQPDGWIDWKPGLGGQRQGLLCLPLLARLAWGIFQYTEDAAFLREVFPKLVLFFERRLKPDLDADGDGLPEWQSESQTGYVFTPTFASWQGWGQGADIRLVESPDLAAYLLSEAKSLREMAYYLRDSAHQSRLDEQITRLQHALDGLWNADEKRYAYRDRDTHTRSSSLNIFQDARGTDEMIPAEKITPPNRLIMRVSGGMDLTPRMTVRLAGFNHDGQEVNEEATAEQFVWSHGHGVFTSRTVFSQIDRITFGGLSRVYRVDVQTVDLTRTDIGSFIPLWSVGISAERAADLITLLTDPARFWRPSGLTMTPANDANYDPSNADGSGGTWPFWLTLMGEGFIEYGSYPAAYEILKKLLNVQVNVLKEKKVFSEYYHSDAPIGLGESGHVGGIVPVHLLLRVIGVRVISQAKVWVGGSFVWEQPVTIRQHGVTIRRTSEGAHIQFPSGYQTEVKGETWQEVIDPQPTKPPSPPPAPVTFADLEPELD